MRCPKTKGYPCVQLANQAVLKACRVNRLVALAFIPNPDGKPKVNHKDGVRDNNTVGNLGWATASEDIRHSYRVLHHKLQRGEASGAAKLTGDQVVAIRAEHVRGDPVHGAAPLGRKYGTCTSNILNIVKRRTWI